MQGSTKKMHFNVHSDQDGHRSLSLRRADGKNLLQTNWDRTEDDVDVSQFRVMKTDMSTDLQGEQTPEQQKKEGKAFDEFRSTPEFKSLPILSQILGVKYNVTGYENSAALALHRLALNAENLHSTLAEHGEYFEVQ